MGSANGDVGTATVNSLTACGDMGNLFNMGGKCLIGGNNGDGGDFNMMAKSLLLSLTSKIEDEATQKNNLPTPSCPRRTTTHESMRNGRYRTQPIFRSKISWIRQWIYTESDTKGRYANQTHGYRWEYPMEDIQGYRQVQASYSVISVDILDQEYYFTAGCCGEGCREKGGQEGS